MKNYDLMRAILDKIKEYDTIMLFRHIRPDGDCVGATKGMKDILTASFPEKKVYLIDSQHADYLAFLGEDDAEVEDSVYENALGIVLDTANLDRVSNKKYELCRELIKMDHHINREPFGDLCWVEDERCSTCELVTHFYLTFADELKMTEEGAKYLYTGLVTDSGRFRFRSVSGESMRCAGALLDKGIDTDVLYAHLYLQDFDEFKFKAQIYKKMKITENGVAYINITKKMQEEFNLTSETASASVSALDSIKGSLIWIAFIENDDGSTRVRLRSRFVTINDIAERYNGGGHACASGATVYSRKEMNALIKEADARIKEYKENNTGWL
jgi:phosphoesterase RecJ-like protein